MITTNRLTPEQRGELEKKERGVRSKNKGDRSQEKMSGVARPIPSVSLLLSPSPYNPVGVNTAVTQYRGGCGTCGKNISYG